MSRIKRKGLDYFPMNTDFLQSRLLRRLVKHGGGDSVVAVLLQTLCAIYGGEGYYVMADELFYEDLVDQLHDVRSDDVRRIIRLAVEYGLFDADMFGRYNILTSVDIQRQYLFSTRRRANSSIDERYRLQVSEPEQPETDAADIAAEQPESAADKAEKAGSTCPRYTKHSIAKQSIANPLLDSSPESVGTAGTAPKAVEDEPLSVRREWTQADVARLQPPADGLNRNLDGLLCNLMQFRVPPAEQYAIVLKSNFGVIGHPVWKGFEPLRTSHGKIRQPGRYLLSLCGGGR